MSHRRIAKRYARALFASTGRDLQKARTQLETLANLAQLFEIGDAGRILRSPVMPKDLKKQLLELALSKAAADNESKNLVQTLVESARVDVIPDLYSSLKELIAEADGRMEAEVVTAVPLPKGELEQIAQELGRKLGKKLDPVPVVDPKVLGGFLVKVGHFSIDQTLKTRLETLSQDLVSGA